MTETAAQCSALTTVDPNSQRTIWGEDAQQHWLELSSTAARLNEFGATITSAAGVDFAMHEPNLFSSGPEAGYIGSETGLIPLQIDPPDHARYRRMLDPLFSPRRMAALEQSVVELANTCIDSFIDRGRCNFSDEFGNPFPIGIFLGLLGLPLSGMPEFIRMKDDMIRPASDDLEIADQIRHRAAEEIMALFSNALLARETEPKDDLLGHFVERERAGDLSREDSLNICLLLLLAGLDTVTGTLECAFALLARRPDLQRMLTEPAGIASAVEELLRWIVTSPTQSRIATSDTVVDGLAIKAGTLVKIVQATWNFDPNRVEEPLTVDLTRRANQHSSFGIGVHRCLGSHLARLELRVALTEWHRRIPEYRLPDGYEVRYTQSLRGVTDLPIEFGHA
ncbi:cytochrome P450 [Jatrophihabitans sp. DSM 45814]